MSEIPIEGALQVYLGDLEICLVNSRDRICALLDECSHGQVRLSEGDVCDGLIECYMHGSEFDLVTGIPISPPATEPVPVYDVRIKDGIVEVSL